MPKLMMPKTAKQVNATSLSNIRNSYNELARTYLKLLDGEYIRCPMCGEWLHAREFLADKRTATGKFYFCTECVLDMATDYDNEKGQRIDNRKKTIEVMKMMDMPFIESIYNSCIVARENELGNAKSLPPTAVQQMIRMLHSLPQYNNLTWKDSSYVDDDSSEDTNNDEEQVVKISPKMIKRGKKRFGIGYTDEEYYFLENEYQDWITRYECNTKAQEELFCRLCFKKLELNRATLNGDPTDKLDSTYQQLLTTANVTPKQSAGNDVTDAQTFGTLIQKYEMTRPLPEIAPELKDIDKLGLLVDVFFKGHLCKMFGLKNTFSHIYERVMKKYTVTRPELDEETDSEQIFEKIFGTLDD